ncbi:response regulator transcription factor [Olivibacter sitiensis]|uniref:response regulator transcription factor n=1 Tax=Olivibacter sitiensis TaxID=376470 RepID=UPI000428F482|nr:response regulator transcription factor [Olivibacter sitiensis]
MIEIAIIDDQANTALGTAELLTDYPDIRTLFWATSGQEMIARLEAGPRPQVLLTDVNMEGMNGMACARWLREHHPDIAVIGTSYFNDRYFMENMLMAGAKAFLHTRTPMDKMAEAIRTVHKGQYFLYDLVTQETLDRLFSKKARASVAIPQRQMECLQLLVRGLSDQEIADRLHISVSSLPYHKKVLFRRLEVHKMEDLVRKALYMGLVES